MSLLLTGIYLLKINREIPRAGGGILIRTGIDGFGDQHSTIELCPQVGGFGIAYFFVSL